MELQGKVIAVLPERGGVSSRTGSEWKAQSFVIETHEQYPHKMVFDVFGADRLRQFNIQVGEEIDVQFDIDAHEYNGRWFNNIRAFAVSKLSPEQVAQVAAQPGAQAYGAAPSAAPQYGAPQAAPTPQTANPQATDSFPPADDSASGNEDDLPF